MGDGKQWFKVWTCVITDPDHDSLPNWVVGVWTRMSAIVATHGAAGKLTISKGQLMKHTNTTEEEIDEALEMLRSVGVSCSEQCAEMRANEKGKNRNGKNSVTLFIEFRNWHKYQVDPTGAERARNWRKRNGARRDEMRRERMREEEKKEDPPNPPKARQAQEGKNPDIAALIAIFHDAFVDKFGVKPKIDGRAAKAAADLLKRWSLRDLEKNLDGYFACDDQFLAKQGYSLPFYEKYLDGATVGAYRKKGVGKIDYDADWSEYEREANA